MWTPGSNGLGSDFSFPTYHVGDLGKISFNMSFSNEDTAVPTLCGFYKIQ